MHINKEIPTRGYILDNIQNIEDRFARNVTEYEYYDSYGKITHISYIKSIRNTTTKIIIPIRPDNYRDQEIKKNNKLELELYKLPIISSNEVDIDDILYELKKIDEIHDYKKYIDEDMKILLDEDNRMKLLILSCGACIKIINNVYNYRKYKIPYTKNSSVHELFMLPIRNISHDKRYLKTIRKYDLENKNEYSEYSKFYSRVRNKDIELLCREIVNHDLLLNIDKRIMLYDILYEKNDNSILLKKFIEIVISNSIEMLENIFVNCYISINNILDYIKNNNNDEYIFTQNELLRNMCAYVFNTSSDNMRNISFYGDINKTLSIRDYSKPISFFTKYPKTITKIFGKDHIIYNYFENNDINTLSNIFTECLKEDEFNYQDISPGDIINYIKSGLNIELYNEWYDEWYNKWANELNIERDEYDRLEEDSILSLMNVNEYLLNYADYENLSNIYKIGFILYTNRYSDDKYKFMDYIIVHPDLYIQNKIPDELLIISLYQDRQDNDKIKNIKVKKKSIIEYNMLTI
tara:strand:- start:210 stop:1775 length:1566 start_codon:yes stop_codon:yes gene_type:complete